MGIHPYVPSYYCNQAQQARPIAELTEVFSQQGTAGLDLACNEPMEFSAEEWNAKSEKEQQEILMNYRIAYLRRYHGKLVPELERYYSPMTR
jgi:leucyl-tRNA synthetase